LANTKCFNFLDLTYIPGKLLCFILIYAFSFGYSCIHLDPLWFSLNIDRHMNTHTNIFQQNLFPSGYHPRSSTSPPSTNTKLYSFLTNLCTNCFQLVRVGAIYCIPFSGDKMAEASWRLSGTRLPFPTFQEFSDVLVKQCMPLKHFIDCLLKFHLKVYHIRCILKEIHFFAVVDFFIFIISK